jgi:hypothetical protein
MRGLGSSKLNLIPTPLPQIYIWLLAVIESSQARFNNVRLPHLLTTHYIRSKQSASFLVFFFHLTCTRVNTASAVLADVIASGSEPLLLAEKLERLMHPAFF